MDKRIRNTGLAVLAVATVGTVAAFVIRDQIKRHRKDLFSTSFFRRLAALGYMAKAEASVDHINLLKDFIAWENRKTLRQRAKAIIERMEDDAMHGILTVG